MTFLLSYTFGGFIVIELVCILVSIVEIATIIIVNFYRTYFIKLVRMGLSFIKTILII